VAPPPAEAGLVPCHSGGGSGGNPGRLVVMSFARMTDPPGVPNHGWTRGWFRAWMSWWPKTDGVGDVMRPTPACARDTAAVHADIEPRLTVELLSVVSGARRRAHRDGDVQIDTAHLLHSLVETDPEVRAAFDEGPQVARVLGYLVQRSIGYGLRWQDSVEDTGETPVVGKDSVSGWSPAALSAMKGALARAERRGVQRAGGVDLLAALAADDASRAVEVLARAGVDAGTLAARLAEPQLPPG
jgi:Clp amino terminal domain, pathogenicity island component